MMVGFHTTLESLLMNIQSIVNYLSFERELILTTKEMGMSSVFAKLSKIDVSKHIEKKGNLSYLSWAWAWGVLMEHYHDADYSFGENEIHADGSVTVHCSLTVEGITRDMWLPVMDNRNKSIQNPTSRDVSDAKMRCLVKTIAMFGLGHYIYAGEDLPKADSISEEELKALSDIIEVTETDTSRLLNHFKVDSLQAMDSAQCRQAMTLLKNKVAS